MMNSNFLFCLFYLMDVTEDNGILIKVSLISCTPLLAQNTVFTSFRELMNTIFDHPLLLF